MALERHESRPVRVLVVDDSRLLRRGMRAILEASGLVVVGECASGVEALTKVGLLAPDVITVDLDMPGLDGLGTIERIMAEHPTPILVVTGDARFRGLDGHFEALMRGAVDLIYKPSSIEPGAPDCVRLVERIHAVARVQVVPGARSSVRRRQPTTAKLSRWPSATERPIDAPPPPPPPALVAIGADQRSARCARCSTVLKRPNLLVLSSSSGMAEEFAEGFVDWLHSQVSI